VKEARGEHDAGKKGSDGKRGRRRISAAVSGREGQGRTHLLEEDVDLLETESLGLGDAMRVSASEYEADGEKRKRRNAQEVDVGNCDDADPAPNLQKETSLVSSQLR
jgi:hypothetical protein